MWYKIWKQITILLYFTDAIFTTRVAKDAVDADILVDKGGTSISRVLRDASFCKLLYKISDSFALNSEYLNNFNYHRYDLFTNKLCGWMWVNVARQRWRHLNVETFAEIDVSGRGNASGWH